MAWQEIQVSSKVVGHISTGIYRSPGGGLRELASNAFDADATRVVITTNPPSFDVITCYDNGVGITPENFERIMSGGIGESDKRQVDEELTPKLKRPVIGRLGIGMLGIAQICHEFEVISHHRETERAFRASVQLEDFLGEKVEAADPERKDEKITAGRFNLEAIDYEPDKVGTFIVTSDVRATFVTKLRESDSTPLPADFSVFLKEIHKNRLKELGDYRQMVWELAVACPIPYAKEGPFEWNVVKASEEVKEEFGKIERSLEDYDFEVVVDGLSLRKPNYYPSPRTREKGALMSGHLFLFREELEVYARPLKFSGYMYLQDGQAIQPMELRGLLIRIKSVAIGVYDPTLLDYPKIEGPRFNWVSGEIYVEEGLEEALNIDRDSFNEMHPHFMRLQRIVHERLEAVFSRARKSANERSQTRLQDRRAEQREAWASVLSQELGDEYELVETDDRSIPGDRPLMIDAENRRVSINTRSNLYPGTRAKRELAQLVAIAYEVSMLVQESERRERFYKLLARLLDI